MLQATSVGNGEVMGGGVKLRGQMGAVLSVEPQAVVDCRLCLQNGPPGIDGLTHAHCWSTFVNWSVAKRSFVVQVPAEFGRMSRIASRARLRPGP